MRIGILIDRLNVGGVEKIAIEQVIALRKAGEDASLIVLREKAISSNAFPDLLQGVPIIYLDERLPRLLRFSFRFPGFSFFSWFHISYYLLLPFVIKQNEFDYLIAHGTYTSLSAVAFKKRNGIPFSSFIWDPASYILGRVYTGKFLSPVLWLFIKMATSLDKYIIKNMDNVLVGGNAHNDLLRRMSPHKPIVTIYPSVHPAVRQSKKKDYVLMVTAWKEGKHPEYLLELMKRLPNLRIKMVGKWINPVYRKEFENLIGDAGFADQIEVIGGVSEAELSKFYANALVLLQTNDDKGFGMPAIEAAGSGTTFIIPEGQGVCELFVDGKDGFYTKERDTRKIVDLLQKLLEDKRVATTMGKSAMERVKENYSWSKHAKMLSLLIKESLER
jgi:glycosyltransferase involved in cell wall biosynthesis